MLFYRVNMAIPHHLLPPDLIFELRRARAKVGNKSKELKCLSRLVKKESIDAVYKNVLSSLLTMDTDEAVAPMRKNGVVAQRKKAVPLRKRKRKDSPVGRHAGRGKARVGERNKVRRVDRSLIPYQGDNVGRARSDKMNRKQTGKFKGVVKEEDEVDVKPVVKKEYEVKKEKEIGNQDSCSTNNCARRNYSKDVSHVHVKLEKEEVVQGDNVLASKAIIKKEPEDFLESRPLIEGQSSSGTVQEVEILDSDMVLKKGITNPFVSAKLLDLSVRLFLTKKKLNHPFSLSLSLSLCFCFSCSSIESFALTDGQ